MRILVADDDAMARLGCKAIIERLGHAALTAQDGEEALRLLERGDTDLLLLDILMPRKDGLATLLEVKRRFPLVTVVAMSAGGARSFTDFLEVARRFGADRTLSKPFQPEELAGTVEECRAMAAGRRP
jgi:CheY-like chemotaxis protein